MANEKKIPNPFEGLDPVEGSTSAQPAKAAAAEPNPFDGLDDAPAPRRGYGIGDFAADVGVTAAKGVIGVGEGVVGIANIPTLGRAGKALSSIGYDPRAAKEQLDSYRSEGLNDQQREVDAADGFTDTAKALISNPGALAATAGESLLSMFAGGAIGRGLRSLAPRLGTGLAAGIGEGAISGGQTAEQIRQETSSGDLTLGQTAIAAGSGALTAGLGVAAGNLSRRLGLADVDELIVGGTPAATAGGKGIARRIGEGALTEGVIEELPQSVQEQVAQNVALDREWDEGVGKAAATGTIIGAAMGAGGNAVAGIRSRGAGSTETPLADQAPTPGAPTPTPAGPTPTPAAQDQGAPASRRNGLSNQDAIPDDDLPPVAQQAPVPAAEVPAAPQSAQRPARVMEPEEDIFGDAAAAEPPAADAIPVSSAPAVATEPSPAPSNPVAELSPAAAALVAEAASPLSRPAASSVRVNGQDFVLDEEQQLAWDAADAAHARSLSGMLPEVYPRSAIEKEKKAAGMRLSAERRRITGALTEKEKLAAAVDAAKIRAGDTVQARVGDQDITGTVEGLRFGRVRINTGGEQGIVEAPHSTVSKPQFAPAAAEPAPAVQAIPANVEAGSAIDPQTGVVTIADSVSGVATTLNPAAGPISAAAASAEVANQSISRAKQQSQVQAMEELAAADAAAAPQAEPTFHAEGISAREQAARLETSTGAAYVVVPTVDDQGNRGFRAAPAEEASQVYGKDAATDFAAVMELAAAKDGAPQTLRRLRESGANLDAIGPDGRTPLTSAIEEGDTKAAARLARAGANLEAVDANGFTALQLALATNNNALAGALVREGASLDRVLSMSQRDAEENLPKSVQSLVDQAAQRDMFTPKASESAAEPVQSLQSTAAGQPTVEGDRQTLSRDELAGKIERIFNGVKPGLGTDLLRLSGFSLETAAEIGGIGPRTFGVTEIQGGKANVRIPFDNIPADWSDDRIKGLVLHEVAVHAAELGKSKSEFKAIQKRVLDMARTNDARAIKASMSIPEDTDPRYFGDELVAYYIEQNPNTTIARQVVEWFRQALRSLTKGFALKETGRFNQWVNGLTHAELLNMATDSLIQHVENGTNRYDASTEEGGERLFSQGSAAATPARDPKAELWRGTKAKIKYVDKFTTMRTLVRSVERELGQPIPDEYNPSLAQDSATAIAGEQSRLLDEQLVNPLLDLLRDKKISMDTLSDYLQARHAPERNAEMKRINPNRANNEALSGMSNEQAAQILGVDIAGMPAADAMALLDAARPDLQAAAGMVEAIIADNRRRSVEFDLETKETVDAWDAKYDFYVPLKREGFDDVLRGNSPRRGTAGSLTQEASGSDKPVENVVAHAILDAKKTINKAAQNDALAVMAAFTKRYLDPSTARLIKPTQIAGHITSPQVGDTTVYGLPQKTVFQTDADGNIIEARLQDDPFYSDKPNVVAYRVAGKDYAIEFNEDSPVARSIAVAYTGENDIKTDSEIVKEIGKITRYISQINTSLNPFFGIKNIIRDTGHAAIAISNTPIAGRQAELLRNQVLGTKAVFAELAGAKQGSVASQQLRKQFNRFRELGGKMEFSRIYANAEDQVTALKKQLDKDWFLDNAAGRGLEKVMLDKPASLFVDKAVRPLAAGLEIWNEALENGTRFAIYKTALDNGVSEAQAISLAQNLTVNFGRKGTDTAVFSNFYGFFNAAVQGTTSVGRTIFDTDKPGPYGLPFSLTPAGKKILVGGILAGVAQAALMAAAGFDDDEIRENDATKNVLLPLGDKEYLRIPMPQGYSVLPTIGRQVFNAIVYGKPLDRVAKTIEATTDGFNPIGSGGTISQTLAPTFLDPFVQLTENKDFAGNQIYRRDSNRNNPTPGHERSKDSATAFSKWASHGLNNLTGGTDYKPGAVSPTPDQIDFMLGTIGGGLFREGLRIANAAESVATGEDLDASKTPILAGYYSDADSNGAVSSRYGDVLKVINAHELEVEGRKKDQGDVSGYYTDFPEARLIPFAQNIETQVKKLSVARRKATERGDKERVKELGSQIADVQRRLIERFKEERQ